MGEHRAMLRTMYLEDILHATAKLHMHNWILLSRNEKYEDCKLDFQGLFLPGAVFFFPFFLFFLEVRSFGTRNSKLETRNSKIEDRR